MKKFTYKGSMDHNSTIRIDGKPVDLRLTNGGEYDLPEDHKHIKTLISTGKLAEITNNIPKK